MAGVKAQYPEYFKGRVVLEVGSRIMYKQAEWGPRGLFEGCDYTGIDLEEGEGVDVRIPLSIYSPMPGVPPEVVVCSEMLEHDPNWRLSVEYMAEMLAPGGLLLITAAGPGRSKHTHYHGHALGPDPDYYGNIPVDFMGPLLEDFDDHKIEYNKKAKDVYFYGIKNPVVLSGKAT